MQYFIKTFGCQMNWSDSERIAGFLERQGLESSETLEKADLVIFNTCGVRQMAEDRVYGQIHNLRKLKGSDKLKIILAGCLANRKDVQRRLKDKVDLFCDIRKFPEEIGNLLGAECDPTDPANDSGCAYLEREPLRSSQFFASVPIMTGCDNFCSYCVVPYARGREVSRDPDRIIAEIRNLITNGCKEITLLGQNVNSYSSGRTDFPKLLRRIERLPGKFWLSFVSSHPKDYSDDLIETVARSKKIRELIHLPLQAGNDEVLRRMNRKYSRQDYLALVRKIRAAFKKHKPDIPFALTSDIIVGFPGETRKQFLDSAGVMEKARFDMVYFGQFSPRPGTAAWKMKDDVSKKEKARREKFLNAILEKTALANNRKYVSKVFEALVDKDDGKVHFARTRSGKPVRFESPRNDLVGKFVKLRITEARPFSLEGKLE